MQPTQRTTTASLAEQPSPPELGLTITRILKNPLAALRASMEDLARTLPPEDPRGSQVQAALDEVVRLTRGVQDLVDYAAPRDLEPRVCSTDEILFSSVRMLPREARQRVRLARSDVPQSLRVDGPQLCQALRHLVDYCLATAADEVLFGARVERGHVLFTLVGEETAARASDSVHLDLGLHLSGRDIPRMGGSLSLQRSARGATCIQVSFPSTELEGRAG